MPIYPTGTKILQAQWERLLQTIPSSYTIWKDGSQAIAECNLKGGTDYTTGTDSTVIQNTINAVGEGKISFKKDTYVLGTTGLTFPEAKKIIMDFQGSKLTYTGTGIALDLTGTSGHERHVKIHDLFLEQIGTRGTSVGIKMRYCHRYSELRHVYVSGFYQGIVLQSNWILDLFDLRCYDCTGGLEIWSEANAISVYGLMAELCATGLLISGGTSHGITVSNTMIESSTGVSYEGSEGPLKIAGGRNITLNGLYIEEGANLENKNLVEITGSDTKQVCLINPYIKGLSTNRPHRALYIASADGVTLINPYIKAVEHGVEFNAASNYKFINPIYDDVTDQTFYSEKSGTGSIANASTSDVITHGCSYTPSASDITITLTENPTNTPGAIWVDTITATEFTVNCENDPGASNLDFSWSVRKI